MEHQCGICQDEITEDTKIVECGHIFCFACISKWCNVSNSCPLCQQRFLKLYRISGAEHHHVEPVDKREENWMEVMEEYDSEEASIHTEEEDSSDLGSEGDRYEPDFVLPDNVVIYESGKIVDMRRESDEFHRPFGKPPRNQPDSIIETADGQIVTISWYPFPNSRNQSDSDGEYESMSVDDDDSEWNEDDE